MQIASDVFQSTLPARGATPPDTIIIAQGIYISIHAPRTGSDALALSSTLGEDRFQSTLPARGATSTLTSSRWRRKNFNPRSPHGERRTQTATSERGKRFQSTLPARGATYTLGGDTDVHKFQSTLPARGATSRDGAPVLTKGISIHAPRTGSDDIVEWGGADELISIHAPRTGSDPKVAQFNFYGQHFNPRSPHGERHGALKYVIEHKIFQSTLPARGATNFFQPSL